MIARALGLVALAACGRIDFDPLSTRSAPPRVVELGQMGSLTTASLDAYLASRATSVTRTDDTTLTIDATWLSGVDLIVIENLGAVHTPTEADALAAWVRSGGAIVSLTGYGGPCNAGDPAPYNSLLASTGLMYGSMCPASEQITSFTPHPLTQGLTDIDYNGGHDVIVGNGGVVIATDPLGNHVAGAISLGAGRVYLWGDDWVGSDTDWTNQSNQLFWMNCLTWLEHGS